MRIFLFFACESFKHFIQEPWIFFISLPKSTSVLEVVWLFKLLKSLFCTCSLTILSQFVKTRQLFKKIHIQFFFRWKHDGGESHLVVQKWNTTSRLPRLRLRRHMRGGGQQSSSFNDINLFSIHKITDFLFFLWFTPLSGG